VIKNSDTGQTPEKHVLKKLTLQTSITTSNTSDTGYTPQYPPSLYGQIDSEIIL